MPVAVLNVTKSANADATFGFALTDTDTNEQSTYTLTTVDGSASRLIDILAGHNYRIEETDIPDNFSLTGSECIGDAAVNGTAFAADQDGTVLCHFENLYAMPVAVLNVTKSANADATFGFALTDTDTNEQSTYTLTTVDGSASRLIDILAGHNYRIEETDIPDNFSLTGSECIGDAAVNGTAFAADQDGTVLCHFENLYAMPVAVLNVTKSANADATFGFALTDTDTNEQSTYTLTTVDGSASRLIDILAGHNYRIEETDIPDNFSLTGSECSGIVVSGTNFTANAGSSVFCYFTNNFIGSTPPPSSSSGGGFTMSSNMIVWDHCNDAENYTILIASTYGDNLYSQIKSSESSYNGINVTAETDFKKYISNTRIPINFYAFSFDGIDQSDIYEITIYDKSKKFVSSKVSFENCSGSVIIFELQGIVLNNFEPNILDEKVIPGKVSYDDIISLCDAKEDKSIITKASTEKLYCVYNSSVEKLMYRGWATQ